MLPNEYKPRQVRPMSELINPGVYLNEADVAGNWYEDLQNYERNLDEMASASLDQNFKEEMQHVDQWYRYLTEAEKTATMYTLLQHSTQVQARFFINLLQQMVKRDPLFSLLTPNNPDQDMQNHLAGAMAKAELEASQRLMSVLPYKTGQVISRPQSSTANRRTTVDRHSFALGDTEEYSRLFGSNRNSTGDFRSPFASSILEDNRRLSNTNTRTSGRAMFNNSGRPHSVIEGDTTSLFPTANWMNTGNTMRRQTGGVGNIGDRSSIERPKSADISNWTLPTSTTSTERKPNVYPSVWGQQPPPSSQSQPQQQQQQQQLDNDLVEFTNSLQQQQQPYRRRANVNRIPIVPETDERNTFLTTNEIDSRTMHKPNGLDAYSGYYNSATSPTQSFQSIVDNTANLVIDEHDYRSDQSEGSSMSRRPSSLIPNNNSNTSLNGSRMTKDKKAVEVVDMELLKDVPAWLRSLRLHKYNPIFSDCTWQQIVKMSDEDLLAKGVAALGARRKMLKVFENIRAHCDANNIEY